MFRLLFRDIKDVLTSLWTWYLFVVALIFGHLLDVNITNLSFAYWALCLLIAIAPTIERIEDMK